MRNIKREISKEIYDRAMANHGQITKDDTDSVYSISEVMGYGVYSERVLEEDGKYYVSFQMGDSCD